MTGESKVPSIRFKGFTDAWEQRKLVEIAQTRRGLTYNPTNIREAGIRVLRSSNINEDRFVIDVHDVFVEEDAINIPFAKNGDILITSANGSSRLVGKHAIIRGIQEKSTVHGGFMLAASTKFPEFLNASMSSPWYSKFINLYVAGGNGAIGNLNKNDLDEQLISIPTEEEQQQIGAFFQQLDSLITLHQRKILKLKNIKKAMLDKMFPKEGSNIPEIRFEGFTDAWEQRELETIYDKIRNAFVGTATPYYVPQGNFYLESNNVKDGQINRNSEIFINDEFYLRQKDNWLRTGDMVMVQSGHVGHAAVIPPELNNSAAHALIIFSNPKEIIDPYFLNYQYQTSNYKKAIDNITTGNTIKHILSSEMKKFTVLLTKIEEQNKISEFFIGLDNLITLHQRKLEKYQTIKNAFLEKMFV